MSVWEYDSKLDSISGDDFTKMMEQGIDPEKVAKAMGILKEKTEATPPGLVPGPPCPYCHHEFYYRTGPCLTCANCASSSSCG